MYRELYQYLILHQQLHLPGIGTFSVEKKPANIDFADKLVYPPAFTIVLYPGSNSPSKSFFHWLGSQFNISERDAVIRFNEFLFGLKDQLSAGNTLQWPGIGTIGKGTSGAMELEAERKNYPPGAPVRAVMVLRQNAAHTVLVGEQEKTSVEMKAVVAEPGAPARQWWWIAALTAGVLSVAFIVYYLSVNGYDPSGAANRQKLVPKSERSAR